MTAWEITGAALALVYFAYATYTQTIGRNHRHRVTWVEIAIYVSIGAFAVSYAATH